MKIASCEIITFCSIFQNKKKITFTFFIEFLASSLLDIVQHSLNVAYASLL